MQFQHLKNSYEWERIRILILTPSCDKIIDTTEQCICSCLQHFEQAYAQYLNDHNLERLHTKNITRDKQGKIFFNKCGSCDFGIVIQRVDGVRIDKNYINTSKEEIGKLMEQIFTDSDHFHIKEWTRNEALYYNETLEWFTLYLHRWLPATEAKKYPAITKTKTRPMSTRGLTQKSE